ncbi:MAG: cold-shock protein [Schleiferiaceae bacterium]
MEKGFGFIKEEGADNEYHVHISGLKHQITAGDTVTFDLQEGEKGKSAVNVMLEL